MLEVISAPALQEHPAFLPLGCVLQDGGCFQEGEAEGGRQDTVGSRDPFSSSFSLFLHLQFNSQSGHEATNGHLTRQATS